MGNSMKRLIYMILLIILMEGCAVQTRKIVIKQTPYSLEDIEKHNQLSQAGKYESLNTLIEIY